MALMSRVLFGLALGLSPAHSQEPPPIRVDVDLVPLIATVTSRSGHYIGGLRKEDFRVYEDGVLQEIAVFESKEAWWTRSKTCRMQSCTSRKR
jgi:hypothetical protein